MAEGEERRDLLRFNIVLGATIAVVVLFILIASIWGSGAIQNGDNEDYEWWEVPLHDRHKMNLDYTGVRSTLPVNGTYNWTGPSEFSLRLICPQVNKMQDIQKPL